MNLLKTIPKKWIKSGLAAVFVITAAFLYLSQINNSAIHTKAEVIIAEEIKNDSDVISASAEETAGEELNEDISSEKFTDEAASVFVHICGEVKYPGVYELKQGSRLFEAIEAAGGFTKEAADEAINMAEVLSDGEQIRIPDLDEYMEMKSRQEAEIQRTETEGANTFSHNDDGKLDINQADKKMLMSLPGIGEAKADAIISYRDEHGSFSRIEDIKKVPGIKNGAFEKIKEKIRV